jgi:hypothetical protein
MLDSARDYHYDALLKRQKKRVIPVSVIKIKAGNSPALF